jgi:hypothetical protein
LKLLLFNAKDDFLGYSIRLLHQKMEKRNHWRQLGFSFFDIKDLVRFSQNIKTSWI